MKKTGAPLVPFPKATFNVFNVLLLVQWLHLGFIWVQKYKKSLIIRTIIRKSLDDWKIMLIFAAIKCNKVKIKSYNAYKYHSAEY